MGNDWKTEIIRKLPWSATFLVASFCFFKFTEHETIGLICLVVAIIALFLVIRFEYYEKIIDRQETQIKQYSKQALEVQRKATKTISDMDTSVASNMNKYKREDNSETDTE